MPYFEIVYETGTHSVACYDDENEAISAVQAQHERATGGAEGGPTGHPAERVTMVLMYEEHPATYGEEQTASADELTKALKDAVGKEPVVSAPEVLAQLRELNSPLVPEAETSQESMYKAPEIKKLKLPFGA